RVVVQDGGKQPISGAKVAFEYLDSPEMSSAMEIGSMMRGRAATTGADGVLPLERLPAGKYQFTVTKGDKTVTKSAAVEDGAQAEIKVTVDGGAVPAATAERGAAGAQAGVDIKRE